MLSHEDSNIVSEIIFFKNKRGFMTGSCWMLLSMIRKKNMNDKILVQTAIFIEQGSFDYDGYMLF